MIRVQRHKDGNYVVSLPLRDARLLEGLPRRLRELLARPDFRNKVLQRLFPRAYEDRDKEAEYRKLLGDDLESRKLEGARTFEQTLKNCTRRGLRLEITIGESDFDLWLGFINDMRLVLGTGLDIRDESWGEDFDPCDPQAADMALLHYLSWLEDELLQARL